MKRSFLCSFVIMLIFTAVSHAQQFYLQDWKTITSMVNVTSADMDSQGRVWAINSGGLFVYNRDNGEIKEMRNIEGLLSINVSAIRYNSYTKEMYVGTNEGYLEIINENFAIKHITDIEVAGYANAVINDIKFSNDNKAYISCGFGITIFDTKNFVFIETISQLGSFSRNANVNKTIIKGNNIWAATSEGVATADLNSTLQDPTSWKNFGSSCFPSPETAVLDIVSTNDSLYAGTVHSIYSFQDTTFVKTTSMADWIVFSNFETYKNKVYYAAEFFIQDLQANVLTMKHPAYFDNGATNINSFRVCRTNNGQEILIACYKDNGIVIKDDEHEINIVPNTPATNNFSRLTVDGKGRLWSATGTKLGCKGLLMFDGTKWYDYDLRRVPEIKANDCYMVYAAKDNTIFASNWGCGLSIFKPTGINDTSYSVTRYDEDNSIFKGEANIQKYIITAGVATDSYGNNWVVNYGENGQGPLLVKITPDGTLTGYENPYGIDARKYREIVIDMYNTKWVGSVYTDGLLYYNEEKNQYGALTTSNSNLLDNFQSSLAIDKSGMIWIGSNSGLAVLLNPSAAIGNSKFIIRKISLVANQIVNTVYVDALNNKWVGTNNGILVLNPDATEILATINTDNSSLVSNSILSITSNEATGEVYIASKGGINAVQSLSITPKSSYDIKCYPQPFNPNKDADLTIEGLSSDNDLKILTSAGEYVRDIKCSGRRAVWDGRDSKGNIVANGVYIIIASSESGNETGTGKIAVIRK